LAKQRALEFGGGSDSNTTLTDDSVVTIQAKENYTPSETSDTDESHTGVTSKTPRGFFADQFEVREYIVRFYGCPHIFWCVKSRSNYDAHFDGTGPEIWRQTNGELHGFVSGAGNCTLLSLSPLC
jgi:cysteine synthase